MAANKIVCLGPVTLLTNTTTNIWSPPTLTGGTGAPEGTNTYYVIRHVRVGNKTSSAAKVCLFKSSSADNTAGKEAIFVGAATAAALTQGVTIGGNSYLDWYGALRLDSSETAKFIVGGSDTGSALTLQAEAEFGIV